MKYIIGFFLILTLSVETQAAGAEEMEALRVEAEALRALRPAVAVHLTAREEAEKRLAEEASLRRTAEAATFAERTRANDLATKLATSQVEKLRLEGRSAQLTRQLADAETARTTVIAARDELTRNLEIARRGEAQLTANVKAMDQVVQKAFTNLGKAAPAGDTATSLTALIEDMIAGRISPAVAEPITRSMEGLLTEWDIAIPHTFKEKTEALVAALPSKHRALQGEVTRLETELRLKNDNLHASQEEVVSLKAQLASLQTNIQRLKAELSAAQDELSVAQSRIADFMTAEAEAREVVGAAATTPKGTLAGQIKNALAVKSAARRSAEAAEEAAQEIIKKQERALAEAAARSVVKKSQLAEQAAHAADLEARLKRLEAQLAETTTASSIVASDLAATRAAAQAAAEAAAIEVEQARQAAIEAQRKEDIVRAELAGVSMKASEVTPLKTRVIELEADVAAAADKLADLQSQIDAQTADLEAAKASLQAVREEAAAADKRVHELEAVLAETTTRSAEEIASFAQQLEKAREANAGLTTKLSATQAAVEAKESAYAALMVTLGEAQAQEAALKTQLGIAHTQVEKIRAELSSAIHEREAAEAARDARAASAVRNKDLYEGEVQRHGMTKGELSALTTRMNEVLRSHDKALEAKTLEASQAIEREKLAQEEAITKLTETYNAQLAAAQSAHAAEIAKLGEGHEAEVAALNLTHAAAMEALSAERAKALAEAAAEAEKTLADMQLKHQAQLSKEKEEHDKLAAEIIFLETVKAQQQSQLVELETEVLPKVQAQHAQLLHAQHAGKTAALASEYGAALQAELNTKRARELELAQQEDIASSRKETLSAQLSVYETAMASTTAEFEAQEAALLEQLKALQASREESTGSSAEIDRDLSDSSSPKTPLEEAIYKAYQELNMLRETNTLHLRPIEEAIVGLRKDIDGVQKSYDAEVKRIKAALATSELRLKALKTSHAGEKAKLDEEYAVALEGLRVDAESYKKRISDLSARLGLTEDEARYKLVLAARLGLENQKEHQATELRELAHILEARNKLLEEQTAVLVAQAAQASDLEVIKAEKKEIEATLSQIRTAYRASDDVARTLVFERDTTRVALEEAKEKSAAYLQANEILKARLATFEQALRVIKERLIKQKALDAKPSIMSEAELAKDLMKDQDLGEGDATEEVGGDHTDLTPDGIFAEIMIYYSEQVAAARALRPVTADQEGLVALRAALAADDGSSEAGSAHGKGVAYLGTPDSMTKDAGGAGAVAPVGQSSPLLDNFKAGLAKVGVSDDLDKASVQEVGSARTSGAMPMRAAAGGVPPSSPYAALMAAMAADDGSSDVASGSGGGTAPGLGIGSAAVLGARRTNVVAEAGTPHGKPTGLAAPAQGTSSGASVSPGENRAGAV